MHLEPLRMLTDGGPFAYLVVAFAILSVATAAVLLVIGLLKVRVPAAAWLAMPLLVLATGALGTLSGLDMTIDAATRASPEMSATLMAAGLAVSMYTTIVAAFLVMVGLIGSAWLVAVPLVARPGDDAQAVPLHAATPAAIGVVGGIAVSILASPLAGMVTLLGGLAVAAASVRIASEGRDADRVAAGRVGVGALAVTAGGVLVLGKLGWAESMVHRAIAHASADTKQALIAEVAEAAVSDVAGAIAATGLLLAATIAAAVPVRRHLGSGHTLASAAAFVVLLLVAAGLGGFTVVQVQAAIQRAVPWGDQRAEELAELGIELPSSIETWPPLEALTVTVSSEAVLVDGEPIAKLSGGAPVPADIRDGLLWPLFVRLDQESTRATRLFGSADFEGRLNLEADAGLRVSQLEPLLRAAVGARYPEVRVLTRSEERLGCVILDVLGQPHPEAGTHAPPEREGAGDQPPPDRFVEFMLEAPDGDPELPVLELHVTARGGGYEVITGHQVRAGASPVLVGDLAALTRTLASIKDQFPDDESVVVHPAGEQTLAELVALLDAAREVPGDPGGGRPRLLYPFVAVDFGPPPEPVPPEEPEAEDGSAPGEQPAPAE